MQLEIPPGFLTRASRGAAGITPAEVPPAQPRGAGEKGRVRAILEDTGACWEIMGHAGGILGHTGVYWGALEGDDQDRGSSGPSRTAGTHLRPLHSLDAVCFLQRDGERSLLTGVSPEQARHGGDPTGPSSHTGAPVPGLTTMHPPIPPPMTVCRQRAKV